MKILFVIPTYEPAWASGGVVTATNQLCRALVKQGIDVTVYTTDADGKGGFLNVSLNKPVNLGDVKVWYLHCNFGVKKAFYSKNLAKKLKETIKNFDLVHVSAIWQWIQVDVYKMCKKFNVPYIVSSHGSFSPWSLSQNKVRKRLYWHLFGRKTIKDAMAFHFTTEDERLKSFSAVPLLKKIPNFVVSNGIDTKKIKEERNVRKKLGISDTKFILLFVGRIHRVKGIHFILEALKKLNNERIVFLIVGNKEDIVYIKCLTILSDSFKDRIIWQESVSRDEVWNFYHSANLFILPSHHENFSMVVVEAMTCGLPVLISKNVGIWREVVADNAGISINLDKNAIAEGLKKLLANPSLLKEMSENARKSALNRYDINKVAYLMIKAYEDILTGRRSTELSWKHQTTAKNFK